MTTYDFIVSEQKKARERDDARRKKQADKKKKAAGGAGGGASGEADNSINSRPSSEKYNSEVSYIPQGPNPNITVVTRA